MQTHTFNLGHRNHGNESKRENEMRSACLMRHSTMLTRMSAQVSDTQWKSCVCVVWAREETIEILYNFIRCDISSVQPGTHIVRLFNFYFLFSFYLSRSIYLSFILENFNSAFGLYHSIFYGCRWFWVGNQIKLFLVHLPLRRAHRILASAIASVNVIGQIFVVLSVVVCLLWWEMVLEKFTISETQCDDRMCGCESERANNASNEIARGNFLLFR